MARRKLKKHARAQIAERSREFYNGCANKETHGSKRIATGIIRAMGDETLNAYKCPFCRGWHIGHSSQFMQ